MLATDNPILTPAVVSYMLSESLVSSKVFWRLLQYVLLGKDYPAASSGRAPVNDRGKGLGLLSDEEKLI